jgi:hypothetical protein
MRERLAAGVGYSQFNEKVCAFTLRCVIFITFWRVT